MAHSDPTVYHAKYRCNSVYFFVIWYKITMLALSFIEFVHMLTLCILILHVTTYTKEALNLNEKGVHCLWIAMNNKCVMFRMNFLTDAWHTSGLVDFNCLFFELYAFYAFYTVILTVKVKRLYIYMLFYCVCTTSVEQWTVFCVILRS